MSSFDAESLLNPFELDDFPLNHPPPTPSSDDESKDVVIVDSDKEESKKEAPKKEDPKKEESKPKKPKTRTREIKAKPDSNEKILTVKEMKEKYESIKHKSLFPIKQQPTRSATPASPASPASPAIEDTDDKKMVIIKKQSQP